MASHLDLLGSLSLLSVPCVCVRYVIATLWDREHHQLSLAHRQVFSVESHITRLTIKNKLLLFFHLYTEINNE